MDLRFDLRWRERKGKKERERGEEREAELKIIRLELAGATQVVGCRRGKDKKHVWRGKESRGVGSKARREQNKRRKAKREHRGAGRGVDMVKALLCAQETSLFRCYRCWVLLVCLMHAGSFDRCSPVRPTHIGNLLSLTLGTVHSASASPTRLRRSALDRQELHDSMPATL